MTHEAGAARYRVGIVTDDAALQQLIAEIVATHLPSASTEPVAFAGAPAADSNALVVDAAVRGLSGVAALQELRAGGYAGAVALLAERCDASVDQRLLALAPARCVPRAEMASALPGALAELSARPALSEELGPIQRELRRTQQLVAMGEATSRIQHTLNNPLAALLAEAQLLEMEELTEEHQAAVKRIVELCRRLVGLVRNLDPGPR